MAILRGAEAAAYLQNNPQSNYRTLSADELANMPAPRKRGFIENLGLGLTKPFRGLAEQIASVGGFLVDPEKPIENQKRIFLTDEEAQIFKNDPLLAGAQYGAGIGAWAIPGGKSFGGGFKGAVASGASSGALSGFGAANRPEDVLASTALGGGAGGVAGGALYGIGQGVSGIKNALKGKGVIKGSTNATNKTLEELTQAGPGTGKELLTGGNIAKDNLDELKKAFDAMPEGDMTKEAMKSIYGFGDDVVSRVPNKLAGTTDDVVSQFDSALDDIMQNSPAEQKRQALEKLLKAIPDSDPLAQPLKNQVTGALDELPLSLPKNQNWLQKTGRNIEYGGMGFKAKPGDLNYAGQVDLDKSAVDWGLDMAQKQGLIDDATLSHQNLSKIPEALGKVRQDALRNTSVSVRASDLVDDLAPGMAQRLQIPVSDAKSVMNNTIQNYMQKGGGAKMGAGLSADDIIQGNFTLDQNALHQITQDFGDTAFKTQRLWDNGAARIAPEAEAKRLFSDYASTALKDASPIYRNTNRAFNALYRQNPNLVNAANRGQISVTGGRAAISQQIQPWAERQVGKVMQGLGNAQAKLPSLGNINPSSIANNPAVQKAVPITLGTFASPQYNNQGQYQNQDQGDVLGTDTMQGVMNYMPSPGQSTGYPQNGAQMAGGQMGAPQGGMGGDALKMTALQLLVSGMDPEQVSMIVGLMSTLPADQAGMLMGSMGGGEEPKKMTDFQTKLAGASTIAEDALGLLESGQVNTGKLANISNTAGEFFGTIDPANTQYRSQLAFARTALRNALLGANMSEKELKSIEKFIPEYTDEPNVAKVKLQSFIQTLNSMQNLSL